jgi:hypothetical protein
VSKDQEGGKEKGEEDEKGERRRRRIHLKKEAHIISAIHWNSTFKKKLNC